MTIVQKWIDDYGMYILDDERHVFPITAAEAIELSSWINAHMPQLTEIIHRRTGETSNEASTTFTDIPNT